MSSDQLAVSIRGLGKSYRIAHNTERPITLAEALLHRLRHPWRRSEWETYWALSDINLDVHRGEVVGIIGHNGAGKSTLLKVLSRITEPTKGVVDMYGRVGSLLEVGTGFHKELTGRENIYLNGSILGMKRREINRHFEAIVDFSGVERFLDTPVKRYSSGMYVRLAFAVAAHLEPEILIVDEVLAVGDMEFQKKCLGKMQDVGRSGRTVLFVSHNMAIVRSLCSRAILLDSGKIAHDGPASESVELYQRKDLPEQGCQFPIHGEKLSLDEFALTDAGGNPRTALRFDEPSRLAFQVRLDEELGNVHALAILWRQHDNLRVSSVSTRELPIGPLGVGTTKVSFDIDACRLFPGNYFWSIQILNSQQTYLEVPHVLPLRIESALLPGTPAPYVGAHGCVHLPSRVDVWLPDHSHRSLNLTNSLSSSKSRTTINHLTCGVSP